jgi:hypothetical protein
LEIYFDLDFVKFNQMYFIFFRLITIIINFA